MNYYVPLISQRYRNFLVNSHFSLYLQSQTFGKLLTIGELAEWLMAAVLKTVDLNGFGGSNPSLSARNADNSANYKVYAQSYAHKRKGCA